MGQKIQVIVYRNNIGTEGEQKLTILIWYNTENSGILRKLL